MEKGVYMEVNRTTFAGRGAEAVLSYTKVVNLTDGFCKDPRHFTLRASLFNFSGKLPESPVPFKNGRSTTFVDCLTFSLQPFRIEHPAVEAHCSAKRWIRMGSGWVTIGLKNVSYV